MKNIEVLSEISRVLKIEGKSILDFADRLEDRSSDLAIQVGRAVELFQVSLKKGGKVIVTGLGKSGKIGQKIAATLSSTGSLAVYLHPTEALHGDLGVVRPEDSVLALSYTGNTDEVIQLLPFLKKLGVPVVGLGGNSSSQIALQSEVWIHAEVEVEACPHNLAPTTSTTLSLAIGDALAIALMQLKGFDAASFAQLHPGGSLGRRLNLKVQDLMHVGNSIPILDPEASLDEVVVLCTQKKMGAVLIGVGKRLEGIITDGDIRRSLKHREKFFQMKAREIMTLKPVAAHPEMMAQYALELMENRPSQISVLPVLDDEGNWVGMLRLHDLVRAF